MIKAEESDMVELFKFVKFECRNISISILVRPIYSDPNYIFELMHVNCFRVVAIRHSPLARLILDLIDDGNERDKIYWFLELFDTAEEYSFKHLIDIRKIDLEKFMNIINPIDEVHYINHESIVVNFLTRFLKIPRNELIDASQIYIDEVLRSQEVLKANIEFEKLTDEVPTVIFKENDSDPFFKQDGVRTISYNEIQVRERILPILREAYKFDNEKCSTCKSQLVLIDSILKYFSNKCYLVSSIIYEIIQIWVSERTSIKDEIDKYKKIDKQWYNEYMRFRNCLELNNYENDITSNIDRIDVSKLSSDFRSLVI